MKSNRLLSVCVAVAVVIRPAARGAEPVPGSPTRPSAPDGISFERDILYGKAGDAELRMNLALPERNRGLAPAVIVIHGGGWSGGNRTLHDDLTWQFALRGYVSATMSYRLAPKDIFPAQIEDAKCAVRFLRAHAEKYGIAPDRIGAVGFSAGGHLAMLLGAMGKSDGLDGDGGWPDQSSKVNAVVSFAGPTNLAADDFGEASRNILRPFLGGTRDEKLALYRQASPITYVSADDAPMLLFQGTSDPLVPSTQACTMADALTAAGVPGRIELLVGAGHGWSNAEMDRTLEQMFRFFDATLRIRK